MQLLTTTTAFPTQQPPATSRSSNPNPVITSLLPIVSAGRCNAHLAYALESIAAAVTVACILYPRPNWAPCPRGLCPSHLWCPFSPHETRPVQVTISSSRAQPGARPRLNWAHPPLSQQSGTTTLWRRVAGPASQSLGLVGSQGWRTRHSFSPIVAGGTNRERKAFTAIFT